MVGLNKPSYMKFELFLSLCVIELRIVLFDDDFKFSCCDVIARALHVIANLVQTTIASFEATLPIILQEAIVVA